MKICPYFSVAEVTRCTVAGQGEFGIRDRNTGALDCNGKSAFSAKNGRMLLLTAPHVGSVKLPLLKAFVSSQQH